jgi:hypothetical protein
VGDLTSKQQEYYGSNAKFALVELQEVRRTESI